MLISIYGGISIISVRNVLFDRGYVGFLHDWVLPIFPEQGREYLRQIFSSWGTSNLGIEQDFGMWILRRSLLGLLYMLGFWEGDVVKIFLLFVITLSGLSMYYLCRKVKLSFLSSTVAGVFYSTTPILFTRIVAGHLDHLLSYAFSPIAIAFFIKALESKRSSARDFMTAGLFYTLASIQIQYFVLLFLVFLAYSIFSIVSKQQSFTKCATALLGVIIIPLLAYLPGYILTWNIWYMSACTRIILTKSPSLIEALQLNGYVVPYFEESIKEYPFSNIWQIFSSLIPLLAFSTILLKSKDKRTVFWSVFGIFSLFFAKGTNPPFGEIFLWSFKNLWVVRMFSEVYHLMVPVAWSYSILLGIFLDSWALKFKMHLKLKVQNSKCVFDTAKLSHSFSKRLVIALVVLILICLYSFPFYTGDFGGNIKSYTLDKRYQQVLGMLSEDPEDYRILWLPLSQPMSYNGTGCGIDPIIDFSPKPSIGNYLPLNSPSIKYILFLISTLHENRTNNLGALLGLANIKYVIYRSDFESKMYKYVPLDGMCALYQNENQIFKNLLLQQKDFILKNSTGPMLVFENKHYLPHLYATNNVSVIAGDLRAFEVLSYLDLSGTSKQEAFFFANQLSANDFQKLLKECNSVIIQDNDFPDLFLALFPDEYKLDVVSADPAMSCSSLISWPYNLYYSPALENWVIVQDTLSVPFQIPKVGAYDLWMKVYSSPRSSSLSIKVDDSTVGSITVEASNEVRFRWVRISLGQLDSGEHKIAVTANGGEEVIARLVIVPNAMYAKAWEALDQLLTGKEIILLSSARTTVKLEQRLPFKKEFYTPRNGDYEIYLHLSNEVGYSSIKAIIANYTFQINLPEKKEFSWVKLGTANLNLGTYTLQVEAGEGIVFLDSVLMKSTDRGPRIEDSSIKILTCQKLSETNLKLSIATERPFFLVFSEAFNPSWLVYINGTPITPIIVNSYANAYYINATGYLSVNIIFVKQQQFAITGSLTFLTISMSAGLIVLVPIYHKLNKKHQT